MAFHEIDHGTAPCPYRTARNEVGKKVLPEGGKNCPDGRPGQFPAAERDGCSRGADRDVGAECGFADEEPRLKDEPAYGICAHLFSGPGRIGAPDGPAAGNLSARDTRCHDAPCPQVAGEACNTLYGYTNVPGAREVGGHRPSAKTGRHKDTVQETICFDS